MITDGVSYYGLLDGAQKQGYPNPDDNIVTYGTSRCFVRKSCLAVWFLTVRVVWFCPDVLGGIRNFPYGLLDTHFSDRGRQGRLISMLLAQQQVSPAPPVMTPYWIGYGIDQNTSMLVTMDNHQAEVLGSEGVTICRLNEAVQNTSSPYTNIQNIRCSYVHLFKS
jgi:hypothetical protein